MSLQGNLRHESLEREILSILNEAEIFIERGGKAVRHCRVLAQRPQVSEAIPWLSRSDHPIKPLELAAALG